MNRIQTSLSDSLIFAGVFLSVTVLLVMLDGTLRHQGVSSYAVIMTGVVAVQAGFVIGLIWSVFSFLVLRRPVQSSQVTAAIAGAVIAALTVAFMMSYSTRNLQVLRTSHAIGQIFMYGLLGCVSGALAYGRGKK